MDAILQGLLELPGVNAAMVVDEAGHLVAQRGKAVYDAALCEQVSGALARVVDSVHLQHTDWESLNAHFGDGKLLLRNLGPLPQLGPCVLVLVADAALNPSFATVAIRVAAQKLKRSSDSGARTPLPSGPYPSAPLGYTAPQAYPGAPQSQAGTPAPGRGPAQAYPGSSSSGSFASSSSSAPLPPPSGTLPSGVRPPPSAPRATPVGGLSGLGAPAPDAASVAFLTRVVKELARHVGPMARVFLDESVRRVCPGQVFSMPAASALLQDLSMQIEDPAGRSAFLSTVRSPGAR